MGKFSLFCKKHSLSASFALFVFANRGLIDPFAKTRDILLIFAEQTEFPCFKIPVLGKIAADSWSLGTIAR